MGLRDWVSGFRRHRDPQRDQVPDMAEIRELARAASAYEQVPAAPGSDGLHRSGFVDVQPSPVDEREMDGTAGLEPAGPADTEDCPAPWTHQWSQVEGGDLTPWMSPEERERTAEAEWDDVSGFPTPRSARLLAANRPNSISCVFSGCSSRANRTRRPRKYARNCSAAAATISPLDRLLARPPTRIAISRRDPFPLVGAVWVTARRATKNAVPGLLFFPGS